MRYEHYKGGTYRVLAMNAWLEADKTPVVVYQSEEDGQVWVRPMADFFGFVEGHGSRFKPLTPAVEDAPARGRKRAMRPTVPCINCGRTDVAIACKERCNACYRYLQIHGRDSAPEDRRPRPGYYIQPEPEVG